ncbi:MAG: DUF5385 domain-containing protein [Ureaplasma sp.]|nr:DUF5385 domain-containing protein [Ureaplasma sp.]MDE7222023.1 DUF5385 domain-containing protein [Ureaplasma sp.]
MGGSNNLFFIILIIIPIAFIVFIVFKKKKNGNDKSPNGNQLKNKQQRDEVWLTIKRYLRDNNEIGKEIIDSYVVKRPDPRSNKLENKKFKEEMKTLKNTDPEEYKNRKILKKIESRKKARELYVVLFSTRNTKTHEVDPPRAIECEVLYKRIDKKTNQRVIEIQDKVLDYKKEMEWIKPIKEKDDKELARQLKLNQKRMERRNARLEKEKAKKELKQNQENSNNNS